MTLILIGPANYSATSTSTLSKKKKKKFLLGFFFQDSISSKVKNGIFVTFLHGKIFHIFSHEIHFFS
jgi:hypothetical protein